MYCKNCGALNDDTAKFCRACGGQLKGLNDAVVSNPYNPTPAAKKKFDIGKLLQNKKIIAITGAVVAAVIILTVVLSHIHECDYCGETTYCHKYHGDWYCTEDYKDMKELRDDLSDLADLFS